MSCNCAKPARASGWTPISEFKQPTEILPGENIDCYMRRAGNEGGLQDDAQVEPQGTNPEDAQKKDGRILNTSITVDGLGQVSEQFEVSDSVPPRPNVQWSATGLPPGLTMSSTGALTGTIPASQDGKIFKVMVVVSDQNGVIDAREYTVVSKHGNRDAVSLMMPYKTPDGTVPRVTSTFGPRSRPCSTCSAQHSGIDIVGGGIKGRGKIIAAADGQVTFAGNAGGYGLLVKINHFNSRGRLLFETRYGHCSKLLVTPGQRVAAGQTIALEGSTGASTGKHLHFEVRLGGTQPVDPLPFIRGWSHVQPPKKADGTQPPTYTMVNGTSSKAPPKPVPPVSKKHLPSISLELVKGRTGDCPGTETLPGYVPNIPGYPPNADNSNLPSPTPPISTNPQKAAVQAKIQLALDEDPTLTDEDKRFLMFVAGIESSYKADAKNPNSSARGVFQMTDRIAKKYYSAIGIKPTIKNRNDPYLATKAQIAFYKQEQKIYYEEFKLHGTLAGKTPPAAAAARYAKLTQGEFMYGLIHHDGVGNAARGIDRQGVDYYRRKVTHMSN